VSDPSGIHVCIRLLGASGMLVIGMQNCRVWSSHTVRHGSRHTEAIIVRLVAWRDVKSVLDFVF
jgi:hypothetical protein